MKKVFYILLLFSSACRFLAFSDDFSYRSYVTNESSNKRINYREISSVISAHPDSMINTGANDSLRYVVSLTAFIENHSTDTLNISFDKMKASLVWKKTNIIGKCTKKFECSLTPNEKIKKEIAKIEFDICCGKSIDRIYRNHELIINIGSFAVEEKELVPKSMNFYLKEEN